MSATSRSMQRQVLRIPYTGDMEPRKTPLIVYNAPDELKHFSKDGPWFRAFALIVCKVTGMLKYALALCVLLLGGYGRTKGWW